MSPSCEHDKCFIAFGIKVHVGFNVQGPLVVEEVRVDLPDLLRPVGPTGVGLVQTRWSQEPPTPEVRVYHSLRRDVPLRVPRSPGPSQTGGESEGLIGTCGTRSRERGRKEKETAIRGVRCGDEK